MPRRSLEEPKKAEAMVTRNSRGGVLVSDDELKSAFEFFDVDGSGKITQAQLKKRLGVFYKDMPNKEYKFLMNDKCRLGVESALQLEAVFTKPSRRRHASVAPSSRPCDSLRVS